MKCLDVGSVKSGMILAQPVCNHQGDMMFEVGIAISEKDIRVLKSWGIEKVWIQKDGNEKVPCKEIDVESEGAETFSSTTLKDMFSDVLDDPVMVEIMRIAKKIQERRHSKLEWDDDNRQSSTNC